MPSYQPVAFQSPGYDYSADLSAIERRKRMAEMLQAQAAQPIEQAPVQQGQFATPVSPYQVAGKLLQGFSSMRQSRKAEEEQRKLSQTAQQNLASVLMNAQKAASGTPGTPLSEDASGNVTPAQPAVPGDMGKAASLYMSDPRTAQLGLQLQQQAMAEKLRQQRMESYDKLEPTPTAPTPPAYGSPNFSPNAAAGGSMPPQAGGMPPQQRRGIFDYSPRQLSAMLTSGDPQDVKAAEAVLAQRKVTALRPNAPGVDQWGNVVTQPTPVPPAGGGIRIGPNGPEAYQIPNAQNIGAQYAGAVAGAQEAGKAPYTLREFNTQGAPTVMTQQQAIERATGQPMQTPGAAAPTPNGPQFNPQSLQPYRSRAALASGGGFRLQDQGESAFQREYGQELGKSAGKIVEGGDMGRRLNDLATMMDQARQQLVAAGGDVNKMAGVQQTVSELAQAMKIDPNTLGLPAGAGPLQLMDAVTNRMAMGMIGPGGMPANNFSEADRNFVVATMSRKTDTPEGFEAKLDLMRRVAKRNIEAEQSWIAAEQQGKTHSQWRQQWNKYVADNPLYPKGQNATATPPMYATNGSQRIVSTDGGKTWQPAK